MSMNKRLMIEEFRRIAGLTEGNNPLYGTVTDSHRRGQEELHHKHTPAYGVMDADDEELSEDPGSDYGDTKRDAQDEGDVLDIHHMDYAHAVKNDEKPSEDLVAKIKDAHEFIGGSHHAMAQMARKAQKPTLADFHQDHADHHKRMARMAQAELDSK